MAAFDAAKAILLAAHGAVSADSNAVGISQAFDYCLVQNITPTAERDFKVKTGGMGEEALTLATTPKYQLEIDAEGTALQGPWNNRHPGEVLTYASLAIYGADEYIRHKFGTTGITWLLMNPTQGRRAGDLFTLKPVLKMLYKPDLTAILVDAAALS